MDIFSVKVFSKTTFMILKFGTELDSDKLYCVTKTSHILLISPIIFHVSFSPMEIFVTVFSAPFGASVFNFLLTPSGRQSVLCKWKLRY